MVKLNKSHRFDYTSDTQHSQGGIWPLGGHPFNVGLQWGGSGGWNSLDIAALQTVCIVQQQEVRRRITRYALYTSRNKRNIFCDFVNLTLTLY